VLLDRGRDRAAVGDPVRVAGGEHPRLETGAGLLGQAVDDDALTLANAVLLAPQGDHGVVGHGLSLTRLTSDGGC
jgi:hypothetical protein